MRTENRKRGHKAEFLEAPKEAHIRGNCYSFEDISKMLDVSRERVRQLHDRALVKLRLAIGEEQLIELLTKPGLEYPTYYGLQMTGGGRGERPKVRQKF